MAVKKILISGAGIAGPTLAYWLHRAGHKVTVIEKAPAPRLGGQNIDISDAAIEIAKMMGIESEILRHNTTEIGLKIVDEHNRALAVFPKEEPLTFTSKYEILRGQLSQILISLTAKKLEYRFDCSIAGLEERQDAVRVRFEIGTTEDFDLVIAADGVSSKTREMIVNDDQPYRYLGVYTSYATIPRAPSDEAWARWHNAPEGKVLLLRPDNVGTTRASINVWLDAPREAHFNHEEAIAFLRSCLIGVQWEEDRLRRDIGLDPDLYLGPVSQVRLKSWSKGRCVLTGDAAYCPTPFTGMGTTLAMIGAYVLAGEISNEIDHRVAFRNYEEKLRPFVEEIQKVRPGQFRLVYPQSRSGVRLFNAATSLFASRTVQSVAKLLKKKPKEQERRFSLPRYVW